MNNQQPANQPQNSITQPQQQQTHNIVQAQTLTPIIAATPPPTTTTSVSTTNSPSLNLQTKNIQIINNVPPTILSNIPQATNITFTIDNTNIKPSNIKINQITSSTFAVLPSLTQTNQTNQPQISTITNSNSNLTHVQNVTPQITSSNSATSTQSTNSNTSSSSTSSYGGFAYCSNCGEYGVKAAFYGKSKLYCSVVCQNGIKKQQQQQQSHGVKRTAEALNFSPINSSSNNLNANQLNQTNLSHSTIQNITSTPQISNIQPIIQPNLINSIITITPAANSTTIEQNSKPENIIPIKSGPTTISTYLSQQLNTTSNHINNKIQDNNSSQTNTSEQPTLITSSVILSPSTISSISFSNSQSLLNGNPAKRPRKVSNSSTNLSNSNSNIEITQQTNQSPQSNNVPIVSTNNNLSTFDKPKVNLNTPETTNFPVENIKISPNNSNKSKSPIKSKFSWPKYIDNNKFEIAPVHAFKHAPLNDIWKKIFNNLKLEVPNNDQPPDELLNTTPTIKKCYWFASVVQFAGYLIKLRYLGYENDSSADFWMHISDENIHSIGWSAETGHSLVPPMKIAYNIEDWENYVLKKLIDSKTIPKDFQNRIKESLESKFCRGMILELVDKNKVSQMRVARIIENIGGRLRLKYENTNGFDDFWCHEKSDLIHPVGWSSINGHEIYATEEYKKDSAKKFINNAFDSNECSTKIFNKIRELSKAKGKFRANMKLEAVDPLNLSSICVASVAKVLSNGYLMISIDGFGNDMFCYHRTSSAIFPAGFCHQNKIPLQPPFDYKKNFDWPTYLKETNSEFAPPDLFFNDKSAENPFKVGMKLESVDLIEPRMICVATVVAVVNRLIRLNFDGWEPRFDQWVDFESCDIYPVGWCQLVGYKLEDLPEKTENKKGKKSKKK